MQTKLARIAEIAKEKPKEQFTSLYHLLNEELLTQCHRELLMATKQQGSIKSQKQHMRKSGIKH